MLKKGLVIKSTGSFYWVKSDNGTIIQSKARGKFRLKGIKTTNPIAVGDFVYYQYDKNDDLGIITQLEARKNYIIRKSTNLSKQAHILASNIDVAFIVVTLSIPETTSMFIDRFLVSAEAYNIPVVLLFNKVDFYQDADVARMQKLIRMYESVGYHCLDVSAKTSHHIEQLKLLMKNKTAVFVGHSGVGKSSLVKAINSEIKLKINRISESHLTGKHTTTYAEMYEWEDDSYIVDTPGIKAFGLIDLSKQQLSHYFPEIFKTSIHCKFQNCTHSHEPQCAVKQSVLDGLIYESRYINYLMMLEDEDTKHR
ncbi:MAG: ribosome small subunit-dependent GTPase A [Bacteroidales bacterium]|nr:ribosome small subunit-dependent GTPase A [Bacteroidales bacterium]